MKEVKILIVEDDPLYAIDLERIIDESEFIHVGTVDNGVDAMCLLMKESVNLILMDISIKGEMNGIELASKITTLNIPVVFLTAHDNQQNFEKAKEAGMHAYLIKPFNKFTLRSVIDSALKQSEKQEEESEASEIEKVVSDSLFVKTNNKLVRVKYGEIPYVEAEGNYVEIVTQKRKYAFKISLKRLKDKLPSSIFFQIHRSHLINLHLIENLDLSKNEIQVSGYSLPIGGRYKDGLLDRLNQL